MRSHSFSGAEGRTRQPTRFPEGLQLQRTNMTETLRLIPAATFIVTMVILTVLLSSHRGLSHRERLAGFAVLMLGILWFSGGLFYTTYEEFSRAKGSGHRWVKGTGGKSDYSTIEVNLKSFEPERALAKIHVSVETTETLREHISHTGNVGLTLWQVLEDGTVITREELHISKYSEMLEQDLEVVPSGNATWFPFDSYYVALLFTIEPPEGLRSRAIALLEAVAVEPLLINSLMPFRDIGERMTLPLKFILSTDVTNYRVDMHPHSTKRGAHSLKEEVPPVGFVLRLDNFFFPKAAYLILFPSLFLILTLAMVRILFFRSEPYRSTALGISVIVGLSTLSKLIPSPAAGIVTMVDIGVLTNFLFALTLIVMDLSILRTPGDG